MRKLTEVEEAKRLMTDAMDWSVFKWLWEKRNVRATADQANAALDQRERKVKARWSDELKSAYKELRTQAGSATKKRRQEPQPPRAVDREVRLFLDKVKRADDKAYRAHMDAENTFDEAERLSSTSLAREGCQNAIESWNLREQAIRVAEAGMVRDASSGTSKPARQRKRQNPLIG
jgi:hypothetical protein